LTPITIKVASTTAVEAAAQPDADHKAWSVLLWQAREEDSICAPVLACQFAARGAPN
jgi:hypothetical protein